MLQTIARIYLPARGLVEIMGRSAIYTPMPFKGIGDFDRLLAV
jgi:hypothetical protein